MNNETKQVQIQLGRETRTVSIERLSEGHCWFAQTSVICKFPSGSKLHTIHRPQVVERAGRWVCPVQSFRNRNCAHPVAFADVVAGDSGWTSNVKLNS